MEEEIKELKEKLSKALENTDLDKARFYSLEISEINDRISFNLDAESKRSRERALARQETINRKTESLIRLFMFIILLQMIAVLALIFLRIIS